MCVHFLLSFSHVCVNGKQKGDQYELIRWPGTVAVLALLLVLCAVLLVGGKNYIFLSVFATSN